MRNYTEKSLEKSIILKHLVESGYKERQNSNYDKALCLDSDILFDFLHSTQQNEIDKLKKRLKQEYHPKVIKKIRQDIKERGIVSVLQNGIEVMGIKLHLAYPKPATNNNPKALTNYEGNLLSIIPQLHYSTQNNNSLDIVIFLNGIPLLTIELKNKLTRQNVHHAINQYKQTRDPKESLFSRCVVHFALDNDLAYMTTKLEGSKTLFLPFNRGLNNGSGAIGVKTGAGNPAGERMKTAYIWERILQKETLLSLVFDFIQVIKSRVIFPRYHQFDVVEQLLKDCKCNGVGGRYLIQHSAGSGKSNSIAWLAHQLIGLHTQSLDSIKNEPIFNSVIVVSDRKMLDRQIQENISSFSHAKGLVECITRSAQLKAALECGKKIIITTIQKFPYIVDKIDEMRNKKFAVIIDEAHSSQNGTSAQKLSETIGDVQDEIKDEMDFDEKILYIIKNKKLQSNVSYFAFTATPKPKTLEMFGKSCEINGVEKFIPFHLYSMKQAIEEEFILDVLRGYTTCQSYYKIIARTKENPLFDKKKASSKINRYVERHHDSIAKKTRIMIDHFCSKIYKKISGKAKAMVVTSSRESAVQYFLAFKSYLKEINSHYKALVAFSGEVILDGKSYSESALNGISESRLREEFKQDKYRFLIVAEKYQTGFDEPLLHTMYVDKKLRGVNAVQTLSRLNRTHADKDDTCVIDFANTHEEIKEAFSAFYEQTFLGEGTDIEKIFDLKSHLNEYGIYTKDELASFADAILNEKDEHHVHSLLDVMVSRYTQIGEDEKLEFYKKGQNFVKNYKFLVQIMPFEDIELEKLSILLNKLLSKLPMPKDEDLARGIISNIDLDSYSVQLTKSADIILESNGELMPSQADGTSKMPESELEELLKIIQEHNEKHGGIQWGESDKVARTLIQIKDDMLKDEEFKKNIYNTDAQNRWIEFENMLIKKFQNTLTTNVPLFEQFNDNEEFKSKITQTLFNIVERKLKDEANHLGI